MGKEPISGSRAKMMLNGKSGYGLVMSLQVGFGSKKSFGSATLECDLFVNVIYL